MSLVRSVVSIFSPALCLVDNFHPPNRVSCGEKGFNLMKPSLSHFSLMPLLLGLSQNLPLSPRTSLHRLVLSNDSSLACEGWIALSSGHGPALRPWDDLLCCGVWVFVYAPAFWGLRCRGGPWWHWWYSVPAHWARRLRACVQRLQGRAVKRGKIRPVRSGDVGGFVWQRGG